MSAFGRFLGDGDLGLDLGKKGGVGGFWPWRGGGGRKKDSTKGGIVL